MVNRLIIVLSLVTPSAAAQQPAAPAAPAESAERAVRGRDVPVAVRAAFRRAYPNATVVGFSTEQKDGRAVYEVETREGGVSRDITYAEDGALVSVEELMPVDSLPAAVRTAIRNLARRAAITRSERIIAAADTTYEFEIQGRRGEVRLRANGTALPVEP